MILSYQIGFGPSNFGSFDLMRSDLVEYSVKMKEIFDEEKFEDLSYDWPLIKAAITT